MIICREPGIRKTYEVQVCLLNLYACRLDYIHDYDILCLCRCFGEPMLGGLGETGGL